ncbi:unnamed protein product, partial [Symbiodinium sp. CCMP2456]
SGNEYRFTIYFAYGTFYVLNGFATALLRSNYREKHHLRRELRRFDLNQVSCMHEFDRTFIYSAISKWYGSKEAFTEFVRQDLRQDLEPSLAKRFPFKYLLLLMAALVSTSMEFFVAMWKGGAPFESLLSFALAILLGVDVFVATCLSVTMNYLTDRFAARRFGRFDHVQTFLIISFIAAFFYYSNNLAVAAYASSLEHCILF